MFETWRLNRYVRKLKGSDSDVRRAAAEALGKLGDRRAVEPLIQALGDGDSEVRRAAARALGTLGDRRAVEPLIQALGNSGRYVRRAAAGALAKLGEPKWRGIVKGDSGDVARLAASGEPRAVELLIQALGDGDSEVRRAAAAAEALGKLGEPK